MKSILEYLQSGHITTNKTDLLLALDDFIDNELFPLGYTVNTGRNEGNKNEWIDTPNHIGLGKYFRNTNGWEKHYEHWMECFQKIAQQFNLFFDEGTSSVLGDVLVISLLKNNKRVCALSVHPEHIAILYYEDVK